MLGGSTFPGRYRGPDRRKRIDGSPGARTSLVTRRAALAVAGVLVPTVLVLARGAGLTGVASLVGSLAGVGEVAAGVALLITWKAGGRAVPAWMGIAFTDLGILELAYGRLVSLFPGHTVAAGLSAGPDPYGRLVPCVLAAVALLCATRCPEVDASLEPVRLALVTSLLGVVLIGVLDVLARTVPPPAAAGDITRTACGTVWLCVAAVTFALRRRRRDAFAPWVPVCLLVLSASQVMSDVVGGRGWGSLLVATGFLVASALAVTAAAWELGWTLRSQDRHSLGLRTAVDQLRGQLEQERAELDEQLHDLRSAVAGIRSADSTLRRYADRLDETDRTALADALSSELGRLQSLIEPGRSLSRRQVRLEAALGPVLSTARTAGLEVRADLGGISVVGDGDALAQVVQNLLDNSRRYAPGSAVLVTAQLHLDRVRLVVADDGPGVAAGERESIFERGVRGSGSGGHDGSGLGLFVASRLVAEMGGELRLSDAAGGACFEIDLIPALATAEPCPGGPERRAAPDHLPRPSPGDGAGHVLSGT